ncbi:hypothetical protein BVI1335_1030020 [Burkholderia vietnamiensis]|nr:hypothetical protein BVI1335_1030020 [Burkholderia vietnamiensis]
MFASLEPRLPSYLDYQVYRY